MEPGVIVVTLTCGVLISFLAAECYFMHTFNRVNYISIP